MSNKYVSIQKSISFKTIAEKGFTLSSSQYMNLMTKNNNFLFVIDFLSRSLKRTDLGIEVGSISYIRQSTHKFLRIKAPQEHFYLLGVTSETALPILPKCFISSNLKEGDLLISKDSNIGEIVILDKDYPNVMTSGAIYKLPVEKKILFTCFCKVFNF